MAEMENASTMSSEEDLEQEEELTELSSSVPSPCLFCTQQRMPAEELLQHCVRDHEIDLRLLQRQLSESEGTSAHGHHLSLSCRTRLLLVDKIDQLSSF